MSMTTRCPDCATLFKVAAEQLQESEGWVRCGRCGLVFDGKAQLQSDGLDPVKDQLDHATESNQPTEATAPTEDFAATSASWDGSAQTPGADESAYANVDLTPEVTFVRVARRRARWRHPAVRGLLWLAFLLGLTGLAVQAAVYERHRLAVAYPPLRPWLSELCRPFECKLGPVQWMDAVAVESTTFNRLRADQYRLVVQLRNSAAVDVALPALELTLKDARDELLYRRVLRPEDFSAEVSSIAAQGEWSGKAVLQLTDPALAGRITNFTALAFYP